MNVGMYQYLDWNLVKEMDQLQHLIMKHLNLNPSYIHTYCIYMDTLRKYNSTILFNRTKEKF